MVRALSSFTMHKTFYDRHSCTLFSSTIMIVLWIKMCKWQAPPPPLHLGRKEEGFNHPSGFPGVRFVPDTCHMPPNFILTTSRWGQGGLISQTVWGRLYFSGEQTEAWRCLRSSSWEVTRQEWNPTLSEDNTCGLSGSQTTTGNIMDGL